MQNFMQHAPPEADLGTPHSLPLVPDIHFIEALMSSLNDNDEIQDRLPDGLNEYGRGLYLYCDAIKVSLVNIAQHAQLDPSTLSSTTRRTYPREDTAERIWLAVEYYSMQAGQSLGYKHKEILFNLAHLATPEQTESALQEIEQMDKEIIAQKRRNGEPIEKIKLEKKGKRYNQKRIPVRSKRS